MDDISEAADVKDATKLVSPQEQTFTAVGIKDNGIFDIMSPQRAIELYNQIASGQLPKLDWKFYGRRQPGDKDQVEAEETDDATKANIGGSEDTKIDQNQTEFDFDEEFGELRGEDSVNSSLQLKNRPEPSSEKKTNLSDIMSDIMKEASIKEDEPVT